LYEEIISDMPLILLTAQTGVWTWQTKTASMKMCLLLQHVAYTVSVCSKVA